MTRKRELQTKSDEMREQSKLSTGNLLQAKSTASGIMDWGMGSVITTLDALAANPHSVPSTQV